MATIKDLKAAIEAEPARSAWNKGVKDYALKLVEELEEAITGGYFEAANISDRTALKEQLLNGAKEWNQYSYGGCALIYDGSIAERLCSPSELKRCNGGDWRPNRNEEWSDVQTRALCQAARMIVRLAK